MAGVIASTLVIAIALLAILLLSGRFMIFGYGIDLDGAPKIIGLAASASLLLAGWYWFRRVRRG
jgi:hypothetical protein